MPARPWPGKPVRGQANGRIFWINMYFVYIIQSEKDDGYYVGMTSNLEKRLIYHNAGRVRSTKNRVPFRTIYSENYPNRLQAREREKLLKSYGGAREKLTIIENCRLV